MSQARCVRVCFLRLKAGVCTGPRCSTPWWRLCCGEGGLWCAEGAVTKWQWLGWSCMRAKASQDGCVSKCAVCVRWSAPLCLVVAVPTLEATRACPAACSYASTIFIPAGVVPTSVATMASLIVASGSRSKGCEIQMNTNR